MSIERTCYRLLADIMVLIQTVKAGFADTAIIDYDS